MTMRFAPPDVFGREDGAGLVMVAIAMPVLILITVFVIDIGNWFAHKRHLQMQADAAVLAAAGDYQFTCVDKSIKDRVVEYAGTATTGGYNRQLGGTPDGNVKLLVNSPKYYSEDQNAKDGSPCADRMIDVKLTETDLPLFFKAAGLFSNLPFINAHARIQFFQRARQRIMPIAVPDDPASARVTFIDEANGGAVIGTRDLARNGTANGLAIWDNQANPLPVNVSTARIGVRVSLGGTASTVCGQPWVECYDSGSPNTGIVFVRGHSMAGSGQPPQPPLARSATLTKGTCPDPYFIYTTSSCTIGVRAILDFGPCKDVLPIDTTGARITAYVGNTPYPLDPYPSTSTYCPLGGTTSEWRTRGGAPIPIAPSGNPVGVTLEWAETKGQVGNNRCTTAPTNKCKGQFEGGALVQRAFSARSDRSGPIRTAEVIEGGSSGANSLEMCSNIQPFCSHNLVVRIGVEHNLPDVASSPSPLIKLRIAQGNFQGQQQGNNGNTQSPDCDPDIAQLKEELHLGCAPDYTRNQGTVCPTQSALWSRRPPPAWQCVAIQQGDQVGQVYDGMNLHVHGVAKPTSCVNANHWSQFPNLSPSDPRLVTVFLTPFDAFAGQSNASNTIPVSNFATVYITGWAGGGNNESSNLTCPSDDQADQGGIVGHFVKYVQTVNDGSAGSATCDFTALDPCVAVLTQ